MRVSPRLAIVIILVVISRSDAVPIQRPPSEYGENSCPRRCGEDYYPVCGQNEVGETKVFVNDCYMAVENCSGNNQLQQSVYNAVENSECPDFDEWINDESIRKNDT